MVFAVNKVLVLIFVSLVVIITIGGSVLYQYFIDFILLFSFYAMFGWIIESLCKTVFTRKFVNSGFLTGPFCPIYGFGALLVIQSSSIVESAYPDANIAVRIIISVLLAILFTTLLEYLTGTLMELLFDSKWWDYSQKRFNVHGRVCLEYSLYWGILSYVMLALIDPHISVYVHTLPIGIKSSLVYVLIIYFLVDLANSTNDASDLRNYLGAYMSQIHLEEVLQRHKRLLSAFPYLRINLIGRPYQKVKAAINNKKENLCRIDQYYRCIDDLIYHESVQEMRLYRQHGSVSCFEHSLNVSYTSFWLCQVLGWNYKAAARGGLLHDLFLYDWRKYKPQEGLHGFVHPQLALNNSLEVCALNKIERDIILKHMFPLTWSPPRYKESMIVCLVDTLCSIWEVLSFFPLRNIYPSSKILTIHNVKLISGGEQ